MGRFEKKVVDDSGINKRDSGYYSTPKFIADFLCNTMLEINPEGITVLDPASGKEELLECFFRSGKLIDTFDVIDFGEHKYSRHFYNQDFIEFYSELKINLIFDQQIDCEYDYYIANPPYNCHEVDYIRNNKTKLLKLFPKVRTLNMYSMYMAALIDLAKEGALIGLIVSDSFLTARLHSGLRQKILELCSIHYLILCPNDLFRSQNADVRTTIIILQKGKKYQSKIKISDRPKNVAELRNILKVGNLNEVELEKIILSKKEESNQFIIDVDNQILRLFDYPKVGELFDCVTGISTGNDNKYLSKNKVEGYSIPFYKNPGSRKFVTTPDAYLIDHYLEEDKMVKDFMVRNKRLLGKKGITCSSMGLPFSACLLPENSTYGVNPNIILPENDLYWMLSYLNSSLVTYLVRGVLIRSNMVTSGYISQLPVISFSQKEKDELTKISQNVLKGKLKVNHAINAVDKIVFQAANLNINISKKVIKFSNNLSKSV